MADWEIVETFGTEEQAAVVAGFLEAEGIATAIESQLFHQEPVSFGMLGQVHVKVRAEDLERARQLLEAHGESLLPAEDEDEPSDRAD